MRCRLYPLRLSVAVSLLAVGLLLPAACGRPESRPAADLIFHDAVVWTVDEERPRAEAVAVAGERIVAVGSDEEVLAWRAEETEVMDLDGAFLVPGFNDSHVHFASAARFLELNVMAVATQEEFRRRLEAVLAELPPGEWVLGGFWGAYDEWAPGSAGGEAREPFRPDMRPLRELTADHPLFLRRFDDGEFAANQAALEAAGITLEELAAEGVEPLLENGEWTGRLRGPRTPALFEPAIPEALSRERRLAQSRRALAEIRRRGVTSVSDMSDDEQLAIHRELAAAGELTVRIHFRFPLDRWPELAQEGIRVGSGDEWIRLGALKGHVDGIMGTSSARFFEPYEHQPGNRGRWRRLMVDEEGEYAPGRFLEQMLGADAAGLQLSIHAIGDEANHLLLDFLEELEERNGPRERRFRLVHAQVLAPEDIPRLGELGVIAEVQPYHLSDDMRWMEERIGAERSRGAYPFRSIRESGARLAFGSDWPGTSASEYPVDPLLGLYAAVTRQTLEGEPPGGWFPEERITMEEAIRAYTLEPAYASFEEDLKGTIREGKLADLTVLDRNLLTVDPRELLEAEVLYTVVGGRIVFHSLPERPLTAPAVP